MECLIYKTTLVSLSDSYIKKVVRVTLSVLQVDADISVHCISHVKMKSLNKQHRGKDSSTDVLSFAHHEGTAMPGQKLGADIFLCIPYIKKQARVWGVSYREEFSRMLIHGILHAFGYDHVKNIDAQKMFALQEEILTMIAS